MRRAPRQIVGLAEHRDEFRQFLLLCLFDEGDGQGLLMRIQIAVSFCGRPSRSVHRSAYFWRCALRGLHFVVVKRDMKFVGRAEVCREVAWFLRPTIELLGKPWRYECVYPSVSMTSHMSSQGTTIALSQPMVGRTRLRKER